MTTTDGRAALTAVELDARVQEIYAIPEVEITPEVLDELGEIMIGSRPPAEIVER